MESNALHQAMRWGARALDFVEGESHRRFGGLTGLRFNVGRVEGGIKANVIAPEAEVRFGFRPLRSEEHTSELQSLMRISYAVFCLKKKKETTSDYTRTNNTSELLNIKR